MLTEPTTNLEKVVPEAHDFLPLLGTDHVELIVGNAKQSAYYYMAAWGFQPLAFRGLETGSKDRVSYVLRQDKITLVLTTPLAEGGELNAHLDKHGDGVKSVALWVPDARKSFEETTKRGAVAEFEPEVRSDSDGEVVLRVARTAAAQLAELLDAIETDRRLVVPGVVGASLPDACQVDQAVEQHRGMAAGEHESVPIGPVGVEWVVAKKILPDRVGHGGQRHRGTRVSTLGRLNPISSKRPGDVDAKTVEVGTDGGDGTGHGGLSKTVSGRIADR